MEQKLTFGKRIKNAFTQKSAYSLPPELFESSRSNIKLKLLGNFFKYGFGGKGSLKTYMKAFKESPLVYMIVNKIAMTTSSIPQVAVNPLDHEQVIEGSKLLEFLQAPNLTQTSKEFRMDLYQCLSLSGNAYVYKSETIGLEGDFTADVWSPGFVDVNTNDSGELVGYTYQDAFDVEIKVGIDELDNVLHIRTSNVTQCDTSNAKLGVSPLEAAWIIVQSSNEKFNAEASIFENRGIIGILTNDSDVPLLTTERERLQGEFDDESGGAHNYNKLKISNTKLRYIQTGMSPTDLKLLEGIVSSLRQLCAIYGLPSVLFNDNDNSTYNNVKEAKISAYQDSYLPLMEMVNEKLSPWLSRHLGVNEYLVADLTRIEVLKNTTNKIMTGLNSLDPTVARTLVAALRINDVLELLGADSLPSGGDELLGTGKNETPSNESE